MQLDEKFHFISLFLLLNKDSKFGMPNTVKYLKISVFGGSKCGIW